MSTEYCSYSVLAPKGKRTSARRSCKKTANASENSDLCEVLNNRCGLKTSHDSRVWNHEHPKTSKGRSAKKVVRKSVQKAAPKPVAPPAPDAKLAAFLENAKRRSVAPELSDEKRRMDAIHLGKCTPRTVEECETEIPNVCTWQQGRNDTKGECVRQNTRAVDGLSSKRRDERTALYNKGEELYNADRADKVGKVVPNPKRK